jgi:hypothetical protein
VTGARFLLAAGLLCGAAVLGVILDDGPPFEAMAGEVITYTSDGGSYRNCIGCPDPTTGAGEVAPEAAAVVLVVKGEEYNCQCVLTSNPPQLGCCEYRDAVRYFAATHHALAYLNEHQIPEGQVVGLFGVRKIALTASVSKLETPQLPLVEERLTWRLER